MTLLAEEHQPRDKVTPTLALVLRLRGEHHRAVRHYFSGDPLLPSYHVEVRDWHDRRSAPVYIMSSDLVAAGRSRTGGATVSRAPGRPIATAGTVVLLSSANDDMFAIAAGFVGALGFVLADSPMDEVGKATVAVASGGVWIESRLWSFTCQGRAGGARAAGVVRSPVLTDREHEVLRTLALGRSDAQIAKHLHVSLATVRFHLRNLRTKLRCATRCELVAFAYRHGLVGDSRED